MTLTNFNDVLNLKRTDVMNVYTGKDGCRCGCNGKYKYASAQQTAGSKARGYAVDDEDVSDRTVALVLNRIQKIVAANFPLIVKENGQFVIKTREFIITCGDNYCDVTWASGRANTLYVVE
jgi:hypothetical protein